MCWEPAKGRSEMSVALYTLAATSALWRRTPPIRPTLLRVALFSPRSLRVICIKNTLMMCSSNGCGAEDRSVSPTQWG